MTTHTTRPTSQQFTKREVESTADVITSPDFTDAVTPAMINAFTWAAAQDSPALREV